VKGNAVPRPPTRLLGLVVLVAASVLVLGAGSAKAGKECDGLPVCLRVVGPWVAIPPPGPAAQYPTVEYQVRCPLRGYIVAGLDAEVSDRAIDLGFLGGIGGLVQPGVATTASVVFLGRYTGKAKVPTTFRPLVGCVPTSGGGGRTATVAGAQRPLPPGKPTTRRVKTVRLLGFSRMVVSHRCASGERLISASHAIGFHTSTPPEPRLLTAVRTVQRVQGARITIVAGASSLLAGVRAELQVNAVCAKGGGG
jgi:hypothetical protein